MDLATIIVSAALAVILTASAFVKATSQPGIVEGMVAVGVPAERVPLLAIPVFAGAAGLVMGLWISWIGIAAAGGLVAYFGLAIGAHVRAKDPKMGTAVILFLGTAAALALNVLSA